MQIIFLRLMCASCGFEDPLDCGSVASSLAVSYNGSDWTSLILACDFWWHFNRISIGYARLHLLHLNIDLLSPIVVSLCSFKCSRKLFVDWNGFDLGHGHNGHTKVCCSIQKCCSNSVAVNFTLQRLHLFALSFFCERILCILSSILRLFRDLFILWFSFNNRITFSSNLFIFPLAACNFILNSMQDSHNVRLKKKLKPQHYYSIFHSCTQSK